MITNWITLYTACHMQCTYILGADGKAQNTAILDQGLPVLTRVVHSIKIGQYPQHMTLCPPVSIVKRCCGYATNMGIVQVFLYSLISPKWQLFYIYVQFLFSK